MNITTRLKQCALSLVFFCGILASIQAQSGYQSFFTPSDTLNKRRVLLASGFTTATYSAFSIGLFKAWYSKSEQTSFHTFNDFGEWNQMDKVAHGFDSYFQTALCYQGARWTGLNKKKGLILGSSIAMLFQTTIEVLDGFSPEYGFSFPDVYFNLLGSGFFVGQQLLWDDQKFKLKLSANPKNYSDQAIIGKAGHTTSYQSRARDLYGSGYFNSVLKDYNAQTFWLSFNPGMFSQSIQSVWPAYLNVAIGYGSDNLYGGFKNEWVTPNDHYILESEKRIRQYYLSLDLDLSKLKVKNHFLKTGLSILNIIKIPAPSLEINSKGCVKGHWLFF